MQIIRKKIILLMFLFLGQFSTLAIPIFLTPFEKVEEIFEQLAFQVNKNPQNNQEQLGYFFNTFVTKEVNIVGKGSSKFSLPEKRKKFNSRFYQFVLNYHHNITFAHYDMAMLVYEETFNDLTKNNHLETLLTRQIIIEKINAKYSQKILTEALENTTPPSIIYLIDFILASPATADFKVLEKVIFNQLKGPKHIQYLMDSWFKIVILNPDPDEAKTSIMKMFAYLAQNIELIGPFEKMFQNVISFLNNNIKQSHLNNLGPLQLIFSINHNDIREIDGDKDYKPEIHYKKIMSIKEISHLELFFQTFADLDGTDFNLGRLNFMYLKAPEVLKDINDLSKKPVPYEPSLLLKCMLKVKAFINS